MKRTLILGLALVSISIVSRAQEEPKNRKNDIGFSARIFNNSATPFAFMYKRQLAPAFALRIGMAFSMAAQRSNSQDNTSYNKFTTSSIGPSLGAEWQKALAKDFMFYAGADFRVTITSNKSEDFANNNLINQGFTDIKNFTFSPLIGVRYNIIDQLYIATEANLNLAYIESTNTNKNIPNGTTDTNKGYIYQVSMQPAVGLFIFYRF